MACFIWSIALNFSIRLDCKVSYYILPNHTVQFRTTLSGWPFSTSLASWGSHNEILQFTVKDYTTKWQALEIGIMLDCLISPLLFILTMELILDVQQIRWKGWWKMNIWLLWMTSPFSSRPKLLPMAYYKGTMTFSHGQVWRLRLRKVENYR